MVTAKLVSVVCMTMALFACSPAQMPSRGLSDGGPAVVGPLESAPQTVRAVAEQYQIVSHRILVPKSLLVSEADVYLPIADIVWHGEPQGDRHAQVAAMFEAAFQRGTADLDEGRAVSVDVQVHKFHALTPKTRATFGGNFAMHFYLTVRDATTGQVIDGPRMVVADTPASGGVRALREEAEGITQKVVIVSKLAQSFEAELSRVTAPVSTATADLTSRNAFSPFDLTLAE